MIEPSPEVQRQCGLSSWLFSVGLAVFVLAFLFRDSFPLMALLLGTALVLETLAAILKFSAFKKYIEERNKYLD
jgi:hypothetical protein